MSQRLIACKSQDLGHFSYTPFRSSRELELHSGVDVGGPELETAGGRSLILQVIEYIAFIEAGRT